MEISTSTGPDRLHALVDEWRELLSRSGQNQPTLSPEWVLAWWNVFGASGGRVLHVAEWRELGRLVALAPLVARRRRHRGLLPLRRLELACSGEPEQDEILSEYIGVVAERGCESAVASTLVAAVAAGRFGAADEFGIPTMSSDDPLASALADAFRAAGWRTELATSAEAPYAPLAATWDGYLASLPSRRRHTVRRSERDLEAWAGGPLTLHVACDARGLATGQGILERLHGERWGAAGHGGAFKSSAFNRFHALAMPALLERGALELLWLAARDEPVAVLYNLVWDGRVQNYQSGRRMDLPDSIRPGLAVHAVAIRRAIELGRREYDFLGGARRYKREFSVALRPLVALEAARTGPRDSYRHLLDRLAQTASSLRRRAAPPESPSAES